MMENIDREYVLSSKKDDLAKAHVDWFLETLRPLLISHFVHGYKHGFDDGGFTTTEDS